MIYLRKRKDDYQVYEKNSIKFLQEEMVSFENFFSHIKNDVFSEEMKTDIHFKLFQLIDIYIHCCIIYKWLVIPTEKKRIKFFKSFHDYKRLDKYTNLATIISTNQLNALSRNIQEILGTTYNEALRDFINDFSDIVRQYQKKQIFHPQEAYILRTCNISFLIGRGLWSHIRVLPESPIYIGSLSFNNRPIDIIDFLESDIYTITESQELKEKISDKPSFFRNTAIKAYENFISLARLYIEKISDEEFLKQKCYLFEKTESHLKEQFICLLTNKDFRIIQNNCTEFCDYCYILIKAKIFEYKNNILYRTSKAAWPTYFYGEFLHHNKSKLSNHVPQIINNYKTLFEIKNDKQIEQKTSYADTYKGWERFQESTILKKMQELEASRK
ncbi:hypothetical protein [Treponema sp.]|uniref:hypothetical protein n=1 Tax=Treponema sp. TaxID=166 RepID=UPI00298ECB27|nr:hypothetical protein [Treponema sp.]